MPPAKAAAPSVQPLIDSVARVFVGKPDAVKLTIMTLPNQDSPLMEGHYPLFGIDVWEHAYYLKYHNLRADYIKAIWNVVNWNFISARYDKAMKG